MFEYYNEDWMGGDRETCALLTYLDNCCTTLLPSSPAVTGTKPRDHTFWTIVIRYGLPRETQGSLQQRYLMHPRPDAGLVVVNDKGIG